ncbi:MAG TPA: TonB-dependent receptor [Steroidobacteraceae bacterium]
MTIRTPLARAIRLAIGGAAGLSAVLAAPFAAAQNEQEEVVVVGSRIGVGSNFESSSPIVTVDREAIANSGYTNLQQLLVKLPSSGNGTFSTRGNNQDSTGNGGAAISLRGLGADATLVLVNGRRVAISSFAESITTNFVDINTIPVSAIERIEVLKDGASAVYGSDAVAGVINVVLRSDFDGVELASSYGEADGTDETTASAIWGTSSDAGNMTIIFDYFKNSRLGNAERGTLGSANQTAQGGEDFRSSRGFPGTFVVDGVATVDPGCPAAQVAGALCLFDYGPFNLAIPASERTGLVLLGTRDFGGVEVFTQISAQHNRSEAEGAPTPLDGDAGLTVPATHPNNPYATVNTLGVLRFRTVDAGSRQWDIETDNLSALVGLRGSIGEWDWEIAGQRGRSESKQTGDRSMGWVRTDLLQQQIDSGAYNPFGGFINPQDVIDQITTSLVRQGKSDLTAFDATVTGDLFDMPAGPVRMAIGAEYREESVSDIPDDQFQRGLIFGTESVSAEASRDITSFFVEFSVPVLENLEVQLAGRYDDYSDFGDTTNPKVGVRWAVTDSFALRGSWAEGFRAPSLAQVGLGPSQESQFFQDTFLCADQGVSPCPVLDYTIVFSGNPDLDPEESESYNFGFVWQPSGSFNLAVDYWDLTQKNKIDEVPFGFLYQQFCNVQTSTVCIRQAPLPGDTLGELTSIAASFINIGEQSASGVDLELNYAREVGSATVALGLNYSHLLDFERIELNSAATALVSRDLTGEYEYPEDRAVFTSSWTIGDWGINTALNYVGSFEDRPDNDFDGVLDFDTVKTRKVDSMVTANLQLAYHGIKNTTLMLGVDNVLDEEPPFAVGDGDSDLYGYVQSQHDPRGRFIYGKATYRF